MSSSTSSSNDTSMSAYDQSEVLSSNEKVSTSCDQKVESCNDDGVEHNPSSNSSGIDAISNNLGRVDLSKDGLDKLAISDDKLFQDPPPKEDCPICMLPMPFSNGSYVGKIFMSCCGKMLCIGCSKAEDDEIDKGNLKDWCSLCRVPLPDSDKENVKRLRKRMKLNDAEAYLQLGLDYYYGKSDLERDSLFNKAIELWNRATELGSIRAHYNLALAYSVGDDAEKYKEKVIYHYKLAAIGGHEGARYNLGVLEYNEGNMERSYKHYMIAARGGFDKCLKKVGEGYKAGHVSKEDYATTLRAYQSCRNEMKSKQRDIVAAQN